MKIIFVAFILMSFSSSVFGGTVLRVKKSDSSQKVIWTAPSGDYFWCSGKLKLTNGKEASVSLVTDASKTPLAEIALKEGAEETFDCIFLFNKGDQIILAIEDESSPESVVDLEASIKRVPTVPEPWIPIELNENKLNCWNREYDFGSNLFPLQIKSGENPLLSGAITISAKSNGKEQVWKRTSFKVLNKESDRVTFTTASKAEDLSIECNWLFEFDGFLLCDLVLKPNSDSVNVNNFEIIIPFNSQIATLFHHDTPKPFYAHKWFEDPINCGKLTKSGLSLPFVHHIWIGNEEGGLQWFAETDETLTKSDVFAEIDESRVLKLKLLSDYLITADNPFKFTFGFMASPVKPISPLEEIRWYLGGQSLKLWHQDVSGNPTDIDGSQLARLKNLHLNCYNLHSVHWRQGDPLPFNPLVHNTVAASNRINIVPLSNAGIWLEQKKEDEFGENDFFVPFYKWQNPRHPEKILNLMCQRVEKYRKWYLNRYRKALFEVGIGGIYLDGTAVPQQCANTQHGCGYIRDGKTIPTSPILSAREKMKQIYLLSRATGRKTYIIAHTSGSIFLPSLSFSDAYLEGEHINRFPDGKYFTLDGFRAEMMGHPYGINAFYLQYSSDPKDQRKGAALALAHDMSPYNLEHAANAWKAYLDFGSAGSEWHPYWKQKSFMSCDNSNILINARLKFGRQALASVVNLTDENIKAFVRIDPKMSGFGKKLRVFNAVSNESLVKTPKGYAISLEANSYTILRMENNSE